MHHLKQKCCLKFLDDTVPDNPNKLRIGQDSVCDQHLSFVLGKIGVQK